MGCSKLGKTSSWLVWIWIWIPLTWTMFNEIIFMKLLWNFFLSLSFSKRLWILIRSQLFKIYEERNKHNSCMIRLFENSAWEDPFLSWETEQKCSLETTQIPSWTPLQPKIQLSRIQLQPSAQLPWTAASANQSKPFWTQCDLRSRFQTRLLFMFCFKILNFKPSFLELATYCDLFSQFWSLNPLSVMLCL